MRTLKEIGQFNFKTRQVKGVSEILWDSEKAEKLCRRYGIDYPREVDHVEDVDLSEKDRNLSQPQIFEAEEKKQGVEKRSTRSTKSTPYPLSKAWRKDAETV